ncbi:MAG: NYN domain-containing protein [Deltaproteobacteria bacterium]|nr:NYN domain-containing protein [Deltaproteobacteria bacterium]MBN2846157.1 NYN domain-containing protein [Deltaproteobacteria bacterium]
MHIIIDGYNLIRQSDSLRRFERLGLEKGREELIQRLAPYRKIKGHRITVVFDGWIGGPLREERLQEAGVHIIYSRRGEKADEVIKRIARKRSGEELVVVTSDREIAEAVGRSGGVAITSPEFETRMVLEGEAALLSEKGFSPDEDDDEDLKRGGKKGPARRLSKKERLTERRRRKL